MKFFRRLGAALAAVLVCLTAGCHSAEPSSADSHTHPQTEDDEIVELDFYIRNSQVPHQQRVMDKANEIIEKKLGVHLNLICLDDGTYAEKINRIIQAGTEFDLCFMANWSGINFYENAAADAFVDMTDLFAEYAPQTYSRIPEVLWDGVKVNDRIYASVNYQQWGVTWRKGYGVRMDIAEEVGFDWTQLKGKSALEALNLLEGFFEKALPLHPDMIGWETSATYSFFLNDPLYWDMEEVGDMAQPGWIRYEEPDKVINQFATPEFEEYCRIMRRWYEKGYVRPDGATLQEINPDRQSGRLLAEWSYNWPDIIDAPDAKELVVTDGTVQYDRVRFSYDDASGQVLGNLTLDIPGGSTVALVGESGAGKTTIASLLPRFYEPGSGRILVDGQDISKVTQSSLRRQIGFVQQNVFLFDASIRENLRYGKTDATDAEMWTALDAANLGQFVRELPDGLETQVGERGTRLSGGQKQRLSIARVFLKNPAILIFDEATSSLDTESEAQIQDAFDRLSRGRTAIVIAHRLTTVRDADHIFVIDKGTLAETGTHEELLARGGQYARLYHNQDFS